MKEKISPGLFADSYSAKDRGECGKEHKNELDEKTRRRFKCSFVDFVWIISSLCGGFRGIRTQVTYWLNGSLEEIEAVSNEDGGYDFYKEGEDEPFVSGGGVWIDDFGNEHALDAQDVADSTLNEDVHIKDDDTIWLKTRLGEWDITDLFRDQDTVRVTDGDRYYEISCAKDLSSTSMRSFHEPFGNAEFVNLQSVKKVNRHYK